MNSHFVCHLNCGRVKDATLTSAETSRGSEALFGGAERTSLPLCDLAGAVEFLPLPSEGQRPRIGNHCS